jgi:CDP-diacylglycerol--glycerol-3-phosphate 3-phosphatidyltransferase
MMQAAYPIGLALALLALALAPIVTYSRAKAEVIGLHGEVGIAPRPERLVVLSAGLIAGGMNPGGAGSGLLALALGIIAVTTAITIIQRILHVRTQLERQAPIVEENQ